ncbi:MAG: hypothetical protein JWN95_3547 [Frankiales bacterium]|nr:hypothetical protein [Frankiales bacterium]
MSLASISSSTYPGHQRDTGANASDIANALTQLVASADPAIVFASLQRVCVPAVCDQVTVTLTGPDEKTTTATWPRGSAPSPGAWRSAVELPAVGEHPAYAVTFELGWLARNATEQDGVVARLLAQHAASLIREQRAADALAMACARADNLALGLMTNREIGVAIGIIMERHKLSAHQAFDLMRRASQHRHVKLRAIASEIAETGVIEISDKVPLIADGPVPPAGS